MTDKKQKQPEPVHYCNTCKHSQLPMEQAPCHECVPRQFGGPDRWESKDGGGSNGKTEVVRRWV